MSPAYLPALATADADYSLELQILLALKETRIPESAKLRVDVERGAATLRGIVGSFHRKLLVRSVVRSLQGVTRLIEQIDVVPPTKSPAGLHDHCRFSA